MRQLYSISRIADLYGLCPDTLRYYEEKGLLHPVRGENRYRMYGIRDICTLNVIRSLRGLDMPVERIGAYLEGRSVASTLALLDEEEALLGKKLAQLEQLRGEALRRRERLERYGAVPVGRGEVLELERRPYVSLREDVILEGEIDFLLKKLEQEHQEFIQIMGQQCMGATLDSDRLKAGVYHHYANVFFLTEPGQPCDGALLGGRYARLYYRGQYRGFRENLLRLEEFVRGEGLTPMGPPVELYHIDAHDTIREEEYLTEIQQLVEPGQSSPWE